MMTVTLIHYSSVWLLNGNIQAMHLPTQHSFNTVWNVWKQTYFMPSETLNYQSWKYRKHYPKSTHEIHNFPYSWQGFRTDHSFECTHFLGPWLKMPIRLHFFEQYEMSALHRKKCSLSCFSWVPRIENHLFKSWLSGNPPIVGRKIQTCCQRTCTIKDYSSSIKKSLMFCTVKAL